MTLGVLHLELGSPPHLPPLADEDHDTALRHLKQCLTDEYGARVTVLGSSRAATPKLLTENLPAVRSGGTPLFGAVLLLFRSYVTTFERGGEEFCAVALRDSTPGRPGSMMPVRRLLDSVAGLVPEAPVLAMLDLHVLPSSSRRPPPAPCEVAALLQGHVTDRDGQETCLLARVQGGRPQQGQAPVAHALDRALRFTADGGAAASLADIIDRSHAHLSSGGRSVTVLHRPRRDVDVVPLNKEQRLSGHIREDLYSPDPGSRLDAVVELADLAREGEAHARHCLEEMRKNDHSAEVRAFALAVDQSGQGPSVRQLVDFGFVPAATVVENTGPVMPPLTEWFDGRGVMGVDAPVGQSFERPSHRVRVPAFRIAVRPTTNGDYLSYVLAAGAEPPGHWRSGWVFTEDVNDPVVMVSWYEARRYCRWLTAQARAEGLLDSSLVVTLPSEAQWEIAARNAKDDIHPWGDGFDPLRCNVRATGLGRVVTPGSFSPAGDSRAGCVDLIGNVWEWTSSAWGRSGRHPHFTYPYAADDGREDPDTSGDVRRVVRGGGYYYADVCANSYTRNRVTPTERHPAGGFRVAVCREQ
ncbi:formylglycine-generating enzyme family protein [Streptomyces sp. KMM 9044]|uniref:formylglycine-generating enzyme family protein n=1 Tax=Streptomyces sp. KMM 9044 TaxID=2744474 RepID=UPI0021515DCE|nr:formylglycine-generating enzyme family protein [Streptomyces sp. KMM 9044]WAX78119.1 formylglycine-generating enzyme family protein [Streptomyces sp. KMM 9044]